MKYPTTFLAFVFIFYSCEYSPSEIPMADIKEPSPIAPAIEMEIDPDMDTIRLADAVWITYSVETGVHNLYEIKFEFDGTRMSDQDFISNGTISAFLNIQLYEDGMHELKITTYTATKTGSIADKTGNEAYSYEMKWPVYINKEAKENYKFYEPQIVPEGIIISWPCYPYADFGRYEFSRTLPYGTNKVTITDPYKNYYIDTTYVEGCYMSYYGFRYYKSSGSEYDYSEYHIPVINPEVKINSDCTVDIRWTHSKNERQVKSYCIRTDAPNYGISEDHDITELIDTNLRLSEKIGFAGDYEVKLRYIPKSYDGLHVNLNTAGGLTVFALGDSIPRFQRAFSITAENSLIIYYNGNFSKYNILTSESSNEFYVTPLPDYRNWSVAGSADGNYFGYFDDQGYTIRRSTDFSVVKKLTLSGYNGSDLALNDITISNSGLLCTADLSNNIRIYSISNGALLLKYNIGTGYYLRKAKISPDGKNIAVIMNDYTLNTTSLVYYSYENNELTELGRVNEIGNDVTPFNTFGQQASQKFILSRWRSINAYNIEVRDCRTFELLQTIEVAWSFVPVAYDINSDRVIVQSQSYPNMKYSYLIDLEAGDQKQIIQILGKEPLVFISGNIFAGNGRTIGIDNYIIE